MNLFIQRFWYECLQDSSSPGLATNKKFFINDYLQDAERNIPKYWLYRQTEENWLSVSDADRPTGVFVCFIEVPYQTNNRAIVVLAVEVTVDGRIINGEGRPALLGHLQHYLGAPLTLSAGLATAFEGLIFPACAVRLYEGLANDHGFKPYNYKPGSPTSASDKIFMPSQAPNQA